MDIDGLQKKHWLLREAEQENLLMHLTLLNFEMPIELP